MLIVMAGLPGTGKSSIAAALGRAIHAPVVSVDPLEAAMLRAGVDPDQPTGLAAYVVAEAVADGVLALGQDVIVDAVNAVEVAREQWRALAARRGVPLAFVEVVCSDQAEHRRRLEGRVRNLGGFREPTWEAVQRRRGEYEPWVDHRLVLRLDSMKPVETTTAEAVSFLAALRTV